jgi:hypothetical protein
MDAAFGAAGQHYICITKLNESSRVANGMSTCCTRSCYCMIRTLL